MTVDLPGCAYVLELAGEEYLRAAGFVSQDPGLSCSDSTYDVHVSDLDNYTQRG